MGFIGFKVCLATEMKANVTFAGKPVAGASVVRKVTFDGKDYVTEVKTDPLGNFILPTLYERTLWKHTPFEFRILQDVQIVYGGQSHLGVRIVRGNFDENGELNNMQAVNKGTDILVPYEFNCDLADEESSRGVNATHTVLSGKCQITINPATK